MAKRRKQQNRSWLWMVILGGGLMVVAALLLILAANQGNGGEATVEETATDPLRLSKGFPWKVRRQLLTTGRLSFWMCVLTWNTSRQGFLARS
jgi:hypothetical protein